MDFEDPPNENNLGGSEVGALNKRSGTRCGSSFDVSVIVDSGVNGLLPNVNMGNAGVTVAGACTVVSIGLRTGTLSVVSAEVAIIDAEAMVEAGVTIDVGAVDAVIKDGVVADDGTLNVDATVVVVNGGMVGSKELLDVVAGLVIPNVKAGFGASTVTFS